MGGSCIVLFYLTGQRLSVRSALLCLALGAFKMFMAQRNLNTIKEFLSKTG